MPIVKGSPVAPGLALGPTHVVRARPDVVPVWSIPAAQVEAEIERLRSAVRGAAEHLEGQRRVISEAAGEDEAGILAVHRMILEDPSAANLVEGTVRDERINAEAAVQALIDDLRQKMGRLEGANVRQYAADVSEPWLVVLDVLLQRDKEQLGATEDQVVLAAAELTPQVVTCLPRERILAIVTEVGGRFSHGAVLARSFGLPCVVGLPNLLARLEQDMPIIVDGDAGSIDLRPSTEAVDDFLERRQQRLTRQEALTAVANLPALTPDGRALEVMVNLESIRDLGTFDVEHCDGAGLLRTEFLYMERSEFPSEEEQYRLYRRVLDGMQGRTVTIRTLDIGGDKRLPYFTVPHEANPQLGWRGLRITLEWQDLMRVQLRAVLRASAHGNLRLLLPMVTSLDEVLAVHTIFDGVRAQLIDQGYEVDPSVPVGAMIEVPSTLWILDELMEEVDFVSVGSNDLTQYLLAVDRDNSFVAKLYEPHHPAVLRALAQVAEAAVAAGKPCSVCGEMAGDHAMALVLLGMGYDSLSVSPNFLSELRFAVRQTPWSECQALARRALASRSPAAVRELLSEARARLHEGLVNDSSGPPV
jgi:phosphoenolpyruvate-protein phosphotransferase (PTS system enzyme I)